LPRVGRCRASIAGATLFAALGALLAPGCSLGTGSGSARGTLDVPDCWSGDFDLRPDFFAAVPSASTALQIRIQNGGDFESFSDGIAFLVDDVGKVRGDPLPNGTVRPSLLGQTLVVALSPSVRPAGVPLSPIAHPAIVHASLYLQRTCRTQNVALFAMDAVTLNPDGSCERPDGGEPPDPCGEPATIPAASADASPPPVADASIDSGAAFQHTGESTIVFRSMFDANPAEANAKQRLTDADFDLYFADPREICPGGLGPPPRCRANLKGSFKFYFERGRPAQPFP
jgi:hypothetical protein